jgi:hypothetical protein
MLSAVQHCQRNFFTSALTPGGYAIEHWSMLAGASQIRGNVMIHRIAIVLALALLSPPALAAKKPVKGVDIIVKRPDGTTKRVRSGAGGKFAVGGLAAGTYHIFIGDRKVGGVSLKKPGTISGTVVDPAGRGINQKGIKGCETCIVQAD